MQRGIVHLKDKPSPFSRATLRKDTRGSRSPSTFRPFRRTLLVSGLSRSVLTCSSDEFGGLMLSER